MSDVPAPTPMPGAMMLDSAILRVLMDTIPDRIYFKDLQSRFVRNNLAHARELGVASPEDCIGKTDFDYFSREHAERAFADEQEIIRTGQPVINKTELITMRDGSRAWGSTTKLPWYDANGQLIGTFGLTRDVTPAKQAEERLTEERNLLRTIIDNLPSRLYVKDIHSHYVLNNLAHLHYIGAPDQGAALGKTTLDFFPGTRGDQALAEDKRVLAGERIINEEKPDYGPDGGGNRWSLVTKVPLDDIHGQRVGLVGITHDITRRKIAEQELENRSEEMEADLKMARQVQEAFLTRPYPEFPGPRGDRALQFAHRYIPATTLGGDFFDFVRLSDTQCGVVVCDVMGHGVRAGLLTALVRGVVEEMGFRAADPGQVLGEINRSLMPIVEQTGQPVFATIFLGIVDLQHHTLVYGNAGHPAPLIRRSTGSILRLAPSDPEPATGLLNDFVYSNHECSFSPGDMLLGFTDGVLEAANRDGEMYGDQRLWEFLRSSAGAAPTEVCRRLIQELETFSSRQVFEDDVCLIAVEAAR